ncbi:MAG TPA: hypothetical protein VL021_12655 [Brumimicrobium sp.]|nr:hypothetical protein [Brumimicrobium sp.]
MKKIGVGILLFLAFVSCGVNMGDRIDTESLSVYFLPGVEKDQAVAFAEYWRDNGFLGENKQVIQLEKEKDVILIKLIEKENFHNEPISITEEAMLQDLERYLKRNIFQREVEIVITDNTFRPILKRQNE